MFFRFSLWLLSLTFLVACDQGTALSTQDDSGGTSASQKNTFLSELKVSSGSLKPFFSQFTEEYTVEVGSDVSQITISALPLASGASLPNGNVLVQPLVFGPNVIQIPVISADGSSSRTYTVHVIRAAGMSANLQSFTLNHGSLSPAFDPEITDYAVLVSDQRVNISAQSTDPTNQVSGTGTLWVGLPRTHSICVETANGNLKKCYTFQFQRVSDVFTFSNIYGVDSKTRIPEPTTPMYSLITSFTQYSTATYFYQMGKFRVSQAGAYSFQVQSNLSNGIYLFKGAFNPSSQSVPSTPLSDCIVFLQSGNTSTITQNLDEGVLYSWVAVFNSSNSSSGSITITPPAGATVTPEE